MTTATDELNSYNKYRIWNSANGSTPAGGNFRLSRRNVSDLLRSNAIKALLGEGYTPDVRSPTLIVQIWTVLDQVVHHRPKLDGARLSSPTTVQNWTVFSIS